MPFNIGGVIYNAAQADLQDYKNIITRGLVLQLDASALESYPKSGTLWYDLKSNSYGSLTNGPTYNSGNDGYISFDGTNDYVTSFGNAIVPSGSNSYTISTWVYRNRNNVGYEEILAQWTSANSGNSFFFGFDGSNVRFCDNWNPITVSGAGNTNVWMNLVGVNLGGSNAFIYLNGALSATKGSGLGYTGTGPFLIGKQGELNSEYFGGNISSVLVYNRALSSTEILQNYNIQKGRFGL